MSGYLRLYVATGLSTCSSSAQNILPQIDLISKHQKCRGNRLSLLVAACRRLAMLICNIKAGSSLQHQRTICTLGERLLRSLAPVHRRTSSASSSPWLTLPSFVQAYRLLLALQSRIPKIILPPLSVLEVVE
jgi:hypothetical protein